MRAGGPHWLEPFLAWPFLLKRLVWFALFKKKVVIHVLVIKCNLNATPANKILFLENWVLLQHANFYISISQVAYVDWIRWRQLTLVGSRVGVPYLEKKKKKNSRQQHFTIGQISLLIQTQSTFYLESSNAIFLKEVEIYSNQDQGYCLCVTTFRGKAWAICLPRVYGPHPQIFKKIHLTHHKEWSLISIRKSYIHGQNWRKERPSMGLIFLKRDHYLSTALVQISLIFFFLLDRKHI